MNLNMQFNVTELKQFCIEKWSATSPRLCERVIACYHNTWLQLLPPTEAQPVIRFGGELFFYMESGKKPEMGANTFSQH